MSKRDATARLRAIGSAIGTLREEFTEADEGYSATVNRIMVSLSLLVSEGAILKGDAWRDWATAQCKGFGRNGSDLAPPTVYRVRNAGDVATIIGADGIGLAAYTALVPLYRLVAGKEGDARTKAEEQVRKTWTAQVRKAGKRTPTEESVKTAVEALTGGKGTRGKAGKTASERKTAQQQKNARSRTRNEPTKDEKGNETTVTVDPAALESASRIVGSFVKRETRKGLTEEQVRGVMLGTLRLVGEHGAGTILAALAGKTTK